MFRVCRCQQLWRTRRVSRSSCGGVVIEGQSLMSVLAELPVCGLGPLKAILAERPESHPSERPKFVVRNGSGKREAAGIASAKPSKQVRSHRRKLTWRQGL